MTTINVYAPITKAERGEDGNLYVYGMATGPQLDLDGQVCDAGWLKTAVPDWFESGANVRQMHQPIAVGVGTELEQLGDDHWLTAKVVDAAAQRLVDGGVLQGFSIGIKSPKIIKDAGAPNGRIVGGKIIEVSLVDRPCNEAAKLVLAKTVLVASPPVGGMGGAGSVTTTTMTTGGAGLAHAGGGGGMNLGLHEKLVQVEELTTKDAIAVDDAPADAAEEAAEVDLIGNARAAILALLAGETEELVSGEGGAGPVSILLQLLGDLDWFETADAYDDVAGALSGLKAALITPPQEAEVLKLATVADLVKVAGAEDAPDAAKAELADLCKALAPALIEHLGLDEVAEKIATALTKAATAEDLDKVAARLAKVETTAMTGGPTRIAAQHDPSTAATDKLTKAAHFRDIASRLVDREQAAAYRALADQLDPPTI